jgi:hypothetical protein
VITRIQGALGSLDYGTSIVNKPKASKRSIHELKTGDKGYCQAA